MEHHGCGRAVQLWKRPDNITRYRGGGLQNELEGEIGWQSPAGYRQMPPAGN
jgi:hypothetical protein